MKKKILVVDDDPGILDVFRIILNREGYNVQVVPGGEEIYNDQYQAPDLFILDKQLSGIDGLDVCRHLKAQEKTKTIPVIMVSANPGIGAQYAEAGADDYIEKPFELSYLLKKIRQLTQ
jgi:DNA-binding response OmpR family regulator